MNKKKILFRLRSMEMGGVQKVLLELLNRLDKNAFDISLLLNIHQGDLKYEIPSHVKLFYLTKGRDELPNNKILFFLHLIYRRLVLKSYYFFPGLLKKKLDDVPDIEIAFMHSNLRDLVNSPFKKSKKINWFHSDIRFLGSKTIINQTIEFMKRCDITVFVSRATHRNVELYTNNIISNGICIHNILGYQSIRVKSKEPISDHHVIKDKKNVFISTGRLVFAKGYDILLEAHSELIREGFPHYIFIIGQGPDYQKLKQKISSEKMEDTFILIGQKENPYPYIVAADYYIQPSRYEAYPLAIGEALALNKPIISTDVGGIREMLTHNATGLIVNFSKENLKEAMKSFIEQKDLVNYIKKNQTNFDFDQHNRLIDEGIQKILS